VIGTIAPRRLPVKTASYGFAPRIAILTVTIVALQSQELFSTEANVAKERTGMYFPKKSYEARPQPISEEMRSQLPAPIYDDNPVFLQLY
jgi:hypothetical protein